MDDVSELLKYIPRESRYTFVSREINRARRDNHLAKLLLKYIDVNQKIGQQEVKKELLELLEESSIAWAWRSSGTIGEIISRWVGLGLLKTFPNLREISDDKNGDSSNIELIKNGDKYTINISIDCYYRRKFKDGKRGMAKWEFSVSKDGLERRCNETNNELQNLLIASNSL